LTAGWGEAPSLVALTDPCRLVSYSFEQSSKGLPFTFFTWYGVGILTVEEVSGCGAQSQKKK
jgi:hypothetical protein